MDIEPMVVHGWKFHLINDHLSVTSEQDPNVHLELEAKVAFSLLDYLYQYRDDLAQAAEDGKEREEKRGGVTTEPAFTTETETTDPGLRSKEV